MDNTTTNSTMVNETYKILNSRINHLYQFVMHYNEYIYSSHKYYGEQALTMIEVHTLTYIEDNPGATPGELIKYWDKTKGAISQLLGRLEKWGLITKEKKEDNAKNIHLYVTPYGARMSQAHKVFDINDIAKTMSQLQEKCTTEEIETFYKVIAVYNEVIKKDFELNSGHRSDKKGAK